MAETADSKDSDKQYFVTKESQERTASQRKESYAGLRDLKDLDKIKELDIVGPGGTIRGIKNRVRAALTTYENPEALVKKNTEEGKIVVYTTSFKGVRHTYEACRYVLTVFHNLRVRVEERNIYIHNFYHKELKERLGVEENTKLPVPQVYINGQRVGSKTELETLNETGELRQLIANIPRQETSANCRMCGGIEFILCRKCSGSKNSTRVANNFTSVFRALKCTHCSENGMEPCPECEERKVVATVEELEENEAIKKERELREQKERERKEQEKRERIKLEALEAERLALLEKEMFKQEKEKKKERAKLEKERKKRAAEIRQKVVEDIARELEREKQWQEEHEPEPYKETESKDGSLEAIIDSIVEEILNASIGANMDNSIMDEEQGESECVDKVAGDSAVTEPVNEELEAQTLF